ncbi:Uncharacterized protein OBRU01_08078, partial [Operophtera brumata]
MRCKEITGGYGLPSKYFSQKARCPRCCLEWDKKTDVKIKRIKLSTRQKQRIMSKKIPNCNEKKAFLQSNQMKEANTDKKKSKLDTKNKKVESIKKNSSNINVYSNALDVFSLKNKQNTLASTIKEPTKIIKNNKRKKDKFAGLCQKAVLASAKIKQEKGQNKIQNKLSLFLKPSLG